MISCVYCGARHSRPADVRDCWARQNGAQLDLEVASPPAAPAAAPVSHLRRGPHPLGRHVVVLPGAPSPVGWEDCRRVTVQQAPPHEPLVDALRRAGAVGESLVVEVPEHVDASVPPAEVDHRPHHELGPGHTFWEEALHDLLWSNAVDARSSAANFRLLQAAVALGATVCHDDTADVVLPGGAKAWLDGGPIRIIEPIDGVAVLNAVHIEHGRLEVPRGNSSTADLAPDQLAAVTHAAGSARIIAPAGSGKTRVLTERARHLLGQWRLPASAICLVAFNKRAQEEMQQRTTDLHGLTVRTLNSIALAIVNGVAPFAAQPRRWRTIDEPDVRRILSGFVQSPKKLNVDPLAPWIDALSLVRLGLLDPFDVEGRYGGDVDGLAQVYPHFIDALDRQGGVDFDDQIRRALSVLLTQPEARRAAQRVCRVLLVDEFQDLTPAHLLLIRLLSGGAGAVFGVGDDDQTIYGYNGADPGWLIDFERWFPGAGDHPLEVNYRCPPGVVEVADRLLRHNRRRVAKTIRAGTEAGLAAEPGWSVDTSTDPVAATRAAVQQALIAGVAPSDLAVLTRVNATIAPVQLGLAADRVAFNGGVGAEFVERTSVRAALAWLRLAVGPNLSVDDLGEALRRPSRALHPRLRDWVTEQRSVDGLLRLADRITNDKDAQRITEFAGDIGRLQVLVRSGAPTSRLMAALADDIGLGSAVATLDINRHGMNRASQSDDLTALQQAASLQPDPKRFEAWLRDGLMTRRDPDGVTLATVHRVKGQEWPSVIVHLAAADQFPHRLADDREEERRLFHVAITRARSHVTIVTGDRPSPFVDELISEPAPHEPDAVADISPRLVPQPRPPRTSTVSDHPLLGRDRVMAVVGLTLVDQGHEWTVVGLEPAAAVAERGGAIRKFALGEKVETAGRQRGPLGPRPGDVDEAAVVMFDLLRVFRDRVRDGKPAYTVFDDKTLAAIASALPVDLVQLAAVKGVGPAKLEQYGDDVLSITRVARQNSPESS